MAANHVTAAPAVEPDRTFGKHLWRIVPFVRPYKARVAFGIVTNVVARIFDLLPMLIVGVIVDHIVTAQGDLDSRPFVIYGLLILVTFIGLAIFQSLSDYAWDTLAQKVRHDLRVQLYDHLQTLDAAYFEDRPVGDIMSVLSNDVDQLENFLADATTSIVRLIITFLGIYGFLLWLDWRLAVLLFAPLPITIIVVREFRTNRMTLAVAHRFSTVRQSDEIVVLVEGIVVERENHAALVASAGVYADLWRVQSGEARTALPTPDTPLPNPTAGALT